MLDMRQVGCVAMVDTRQAHGQGERVRPRVSVCRMCACDVRFVCDLWRVMAESERWQGRAIDLDFLMTFAENDSLQLFGAICAGVVMDVDGWAPPFSNTSQNMPN